MLKIAFIGYNAEQGHMALQSFAVANVDQVQRYERNRGRILLKDGTEILDVSARDILDLYWPLFDQVIIADDRRLRIMQQRSLILSALDWCCRHSSVPEEYRRQIYDLDAEVPQNDV